MKLVLEVERLQEMVDGEIDSINSVHKTGTPK